MSEQAAAAAGAGVIGPVVDAAWLAAHRSEVVVADVRWYLDGRSGRAAYDAGHLPGAVFVDLDRWLAAHGTPGEGRHPLPSPEVFAEGMSSLGIDDASTVIAYDDAGGVIAARLVWMLRATGHAAAFLDGGIAAWTGPLEQAPGFAAADEGAAAAADAAAAGASTESAAQHTAIRAGKGGDSGASSGSQFTPTPWPTDRLASIDEAASHDFVVLDARDADRYRGDTEPVDPRAGHILGARSLPCRGHVTEGGRLAPVAELRERFAAVGVADTDAGSAVISYCGSGVTACHNLLVQEHAGLGVGRLYPGSWSQYSSDPSRPAATGD